MGIVPKFSKADVEKRFNNFLRVIEKRQIERLQYLGEMCVSHARSIPKDVGFEDQTGNLRSSIGYVVFKNGVAVKDNYVNVLGGSEGVKAGKELAREKGAKYKDGFVLIVTAGMEYAVHVEAKGRDVLTSAESLATNELPKILNELKLNINRALN
jgi:hypothetical protein